MTLLKRIVSTAVASLAISAFVRVSAFALSANPDFTPALTSTKTWDNAGEFSIVNANGNTRSTTTSVKNTYHYHWSRTLLELIGDALGSSNRSGVTAEQYDASEKVSWLMTGKNYTFERAAWLKNRFSGIRNQYNGTVGVGRYFIDRPKDILLFEVGPGYINTEYTDQPRVDYASGRAFANYTHNLSETAKFTQNIEYLHDFANSKNYYLNTETAVIAAMTSHLSLKGSYAWNRAGQPPARFGKDDTLTQVSLIVNF